jgi:hypothetical protein
VAAAQREVSKSELEAREVDAEKAIVDAERENAVALDPPVMSSLLIHQATSPVYSPVGQSIHQATSLEAASLEGLASPDG